MKKGSLTWDTLGKIVLGVAFLLLILYLIFVSKDKLVEVGGGLLNVLKFG